MLFSGESGSGKTTIQNMFPAKNRFYDESILIKETKGSVESFYAYSFPNSLGYDNFVNNNEGVKALFFLKQSKTTYLRKLTYRVSYRKLVKNFYYFGNDTGVEFLGFYEAAKSFCRNIDCYDLFFSLDCDPAGLIIKQIYRGG